MKTTQTNIEEAARRLREASASGTPCNPIRELLEPGDIDAAYAVQRVNTDIRLAAGESLVGRKIGLTAKSVRDQMNVNECDSGVLFAADIFRDDEEIPQSRVIQPMVEGEVALVLDKDITKERPTIADVVMATAYCLPSIEIVDSRISNWEIGIQDTVADNASALFAVLGTTPMRLEGLDLQLCGMKMDRNGEMAAIGVGAACLGSPINAAAWLARRMVEVGQPLQAGDIVLTGALGPVVKVAAGDVIEVSIAGLGSVKTRFSK